MIFGTAESFDEQGHVVALGHTGVEKAIALGFTEFDTAPVYGNQHEMSFPISLGNPIRVISKLPFNKFGYDNVIKEFEKETLPITDYYIHWPFMNNQFQYEIKGTWEAFEYLHNKYNIKIGVCNFTENHLKRTFQTCTIPPAVNQIELNLKCQNNDLVNFCLKNNIEVQSYSSIRRGELSGLESVKWLLGLGVNPIVRSTKSHRLKRYLQATPMVETNMEKYHTGERFCPDPYEIPS